MAIEFGNNFLPEAFTRRAAEALVGATVRKRLIDPDNPAVVPGRIGKIIRHEESEEADGYSIIVDWGDNERWAYLPAGFAADVIIVAAPSRDPS